MQLNFNITFDQLHTHAGLAALDARFAEWLKGEDVTLFNRLMAGRAEPAALVAKEHSELLVALAPFLEQFIAKLFDIEREMAALVAAHHELAPLFACKRLFVQRRAAKAFKEEEVRSWGMGDESWAENYSAGLTKDSELMTHDQQEITFATRVMSWLADEAAHKAELEEAARYAAWALYHPLGKGKHAHGLLFRLPKKLDPEALIAVETEVRNGVTVMKASAHHLRARHGFSLTDPGGTLAQALDQANYCIFCHHQGKDSCSKGMREKDGVFKKNALNITLAGCPLEEKISEMNQLKSEGVPLGALAMVCVDNPMCAGTGHRICNDCMKSCIYQKQEPVNIPLQETRTLKDILELPYGFEIYALLTRWNPLNLHRPLPKPDSGYKVLVAGLGPAGYTLSHHLLNDGHMVVAMDGLKIEPLPPEISGVDADGGRVPFQPIKDVNALIEDLNARTLAGFGGVAEYGITVRWDKNYLKMIRLLLERRAAFTMFGGVRFGSNITYTQAFDMGFDHIALCLGAGKPTILDIPNGLARGVRTASDFLMSLQLTGAAKADSIANLQLRLPVVVIGGGLTAIDTATESLAYYPVQVEKFLQRYEMLAHERGEEAVRAGWSEEERQIAEEFIAHAKAIRTARAEGVENLIPLLQRWGGASVVYRKRLQDAPSYRLNHEEVEKALEKGIFFIENLEPKAVEVDGFGYVQALRAKSLVTGHGALENAESPTTHDPHPMTIPARTVLIAAGTSPNTVLAREDAEHFQLDGHYFRALDEEGNMVKPERVSKPAEVRVLMSLDAEGRGVSFFGDLHPSFAGNVVKAMGSAKQGYPVVTRVLERSAPRVQDDAFSRHLNTQLRACVHAVNRLTPNIIEVVVHAPLAAMNFQPGQFYRLQNFEAFAKKVDSGKWIVESIMASPSTSHSSLSTTLAMEGLALTGASVDREKGLLSLIVLEMGGSSDLCAQLSPGEPVVLMGPTGAPTDIPENETIALVGGGLGNAVLFSIGQAARAKGSRVLYFAGYKKLIDRYKVEEIEAAADVIVWCSDEAPGFQPTRPQDRSFVGNIVQAMKAYGSGALGAQMIAMPDVSHLIAIGSDRMMAAVAYARHHELKHYFSAGHVAVASINSPMQCMMKEICAQCLQKHIDPETGAESYVFSCFNQDQPLDCVVWPELNARLKQNTVQEKLTAQWVDRSLKALGSR